MSQDILQAEIHQQILVNEKETKIRIRTHLANINDQISSEDIANVKTDVFLPLATGPVNYTNKKSRARKETV